MRLHAVVYTEKEDPTRLRLDSAWSSELVTAEPKVAHVAAAHMLEQPEVLTAGVAVVDVPDDVILPYLATAPQRGMGPVVQATVHAIEQP